MARQRLVVVRRSECLARGGEGFSDYFEDPVPTTCLVLLADILPRQSQLPDRVKRKGTVVSLPLLKPAAFRRKLSSLAIERGLRLEPDALNLLAERAGRSLSRGVMELEKLSVWETKGGRVDRETVAAVVDDSRLDTLFDLADALGRRQLARALESLHRLRGVPPLVLLAAIGRHFRRLLELRAQLEAKGPRAEGERGYYLEKMTSQASLFSPQEIRRVFFHLHGLDLALKGTGTPERLLLEELAFAICGSAEEGGLRRENPPGEASGRRPAC
jgi:DNA polymerase-3 subunit delta